MSRNSRPAESEEKETGIFRPKGIMWHWIRMALYLALGCCSIWYGCFVRSAGAGNTFYQVWFVLGVVFFGLAAAVYFRVWGRMPRALRYVLTDCTVFCFAVYVALMARIASSFSAEPGEPEYVIVLGAQMREEGPSVVLRYRLETATEYLQEHPGVKCIVSGGRGANESVSEAEGMRDYLVSHGIETSRIILEDRSTDTSENLRFSQSLLPSPETQVGIITNNFHMYRAKGIAKKCGYANAIAVPAKSTAAYLLHNMTREVVGVLKDVLTGNMALR